MDNLTDNQATPPETPPEAAPESAAPADGGVSSTPENEADKGLGAKPESAPPTESPQPSGQEVQNQVQLDQARRQSKKTGNKSTRQPSNASRANWLTRRLRTAPVNIQITTTVTSIPEQRSRPQENSQAGIGGGDAGNIASSGQAGQSGEQGFQEGGGRAPETESGGPESGSTPETGEQQPENSEGQADGKGPEAGRGQQPSQGDWDQDTVKRRRGATKTAKAAKGAAGAAEGAAAGEGMAATVAESKGNIWMLVILWIKKHPSQTAMIVFVALLLNFIFWFLPICLLTATTRTLLPDWLNPLASLCPI